MNYPVNVLLNKTEEDIVKAVKNLANERNIPMDFMIFSMRGALLRIQNEAYANLTDMSIEALNQLDKVSKDFEALKESNAVQENNDTK